MWILIISDQVKLFRDNTDPVKEYVLKQLCCVRNAMYDEREDCNICSMSVTFAELSADDPRL